MSNKNNICANCGKGEEASNDLKACTACKLVKYCNRDCQIAHRSQHKKECKKRAKELHDEKLFKQPPSQFGECPICFLRLPSLKTGYRYKSCCGKVICSGCIHAPLYDHQGNEVDNQKCPFCRSPKPTSEESIERIKKRVKAGDPIAIYMQGDCYFYADVTDGYPQDYTKALELWHQAAELGNAEAFCNIGNAYQYGEGVDVDRKKAVHYFELAAMGGDEVARNNLGVDEEREGNIDRALKHYMIAVGCGNSDSLNTIKGLYSYGRATKEDYTTALQAYQVYLDEIKSKQRDEAAATYKDCRYY